MSKELIKALEALHAPVGIFNDCGHDHTLSDDTTPAENLFNIPDIGIVCFEGIDYYICKECCMEQGEPSENCFYHHDHLKDDEAICKTNKYIKEFS